MTYFLKSLIYLLLFSFKTNMLCTFFGKGAQENIIDLRTSCTNNSTEDIYLPINMGKADSVVVMISFKIIKPNCNLNFLTFPKNGVGIILLLEFVGKLQLQACSRNQIIVQNDNKIDVCSRINDTTNSLKKLSLYKIKHITRKVSVSINGFEPNLLETIKIIATAATILENNTFCDQVTCMWDNTTICISKELQCDGILQCGTPHKYDEDSKVCNVVQKRKWLVVLLTLVMLAVLLFLVYRYTRRNFPISQEDYFILPNENKGNKLVVTPQMKSPEINMIFSNLAKRQTIYSSSESSSREAISAISNKKVLSPSCVLQPPLNIFSRASAEECKTFKKINTTANCNRWPIYQKLPLPPYEKRLTEDMKLKMLSRRDDREKPLKVTFYSTTTKL